MLECYEFSKNLSSGFYRVVIFDAFMNASKITLAMCLTAPIKDLKKCLVKIQDIFSHKNKYVKYPYTLSQTMSQQLKKKIPKAWGLYRVDQEPYTIGLKRSISY